MRQITTIADLDTAMRGADGHQLEMIQKYGKPYAARAADREVTRRIAAARVQGEAALGRFLTADRARWTR